MADAVKGHLQHDVLPVKMLIAEHDGSRCGQNATRPDLKP